MTNLDSILLAGQALTANATAVDHILNAAFLYGPGLLLALAIRAGWKTARWTASRLYDWHDRRRDRQHTIRELRHLYYLTPAYRRTEDQR